MRRAWDVLGEAAEAAIGKGVAEAGVRRVSRGKPALKCAEEASTSVSKRRYQGGRTQGVMTAGRAKLRVNARANAPAAGRGADSSLNSKGLQTRSKVLAEAATAPSAGRSAKKEATVNREPKVAEEQNEELSSEPTLRALVAHWSPALAGQVPDIPLSAALKAWHTGSLQRTPRSAITDPSTPPLLYPARKDDVGPFVKGEAPKVMPKAAARLAAQDAAQEAAQKAQKAAQVAKAAQEAAQKAAQEAAQEAAQVAEEAAQKAAQETAAAVAILGPPPVFKEAVAFPADVTGKPSKKRKRARGFEPRRGHRKVRVSAEARSLLATEERIPWTHVQSTWKQRRGMWRKEVRDNAKSQEALVAFVAELRSAINRQTWRAALDRWAQPLVGSADVPPRSGRDYDEQGEGLEVEMRNKQGMEEYEDDLEEGADVEDESKEESYEDELKGEAEDELEDDLQETDEEEILVAPRFTPGTAPTSSLSVPDDNLDILPLNDLERFPAVGIPAIDTERHHAEAARPKDEVLCCSQVEKQVLGLQFAIHEGGLTSAAHLGSMVSFDMPETGLPETDLETGYDTDATDMSDG